jgi:hypothetical protein
MGLRNFDMALITLVYVSTKRREITEDDLKNILNTARTFNPTASITGMLLYRDGFFMQALEGEEDDVKGLFQKIALDERHKNVLMIYSTSIEERTFSDWSMGFNKISDEEWQSLDGLNDFMQKPAGIEYFQENPSRALTLLQHFRDKSYF